ncbi:ABC transporter ATP-binding protein [Paracoccaceae bacterium]|jgi:ABC-type branched-subunit amino acid transport system ATPase component|nr:ABC transporter ATP-binding protein [Paracoccaceae bacterium]|tara:strand:+ start:2398 stop:3171 length:774 start_codon:yes stop_codon:yes gene_type:complete
MTDNILVADNLTKQFGGLKAVGGDTGLNFGVKRGSLVGLIGPNGAGKSTIFNLISGVLEPSSGRVRLNGKSLAKIKSSEIASHGLGRTFQTPRAFPSLTVLENVLVGAKSSGEHLSSVFSGKWKVDDISLKKKASEVIQKVGLEDRIGDTVANLSGGELRMLEVARQLIRDPAILLLDEPTAGVDPSLQGKLSSILVELHNEGKTLIVVEHNLHFLLSIADVVLVLQNGELLAEGSPTEIQNNKRVIAAYLGDEYAA